ncbi:hypothetical protein [Shewanella sp.]|uniref:hypothetical protein n=1 Tax=Shewanella sp. TaxID=50422 RepID=UPI0040545ABC
MQRTYPLTVTTQGPLYPPSEIMNADGHFVVVGNILRQSPTGIDMQWGAALVSASSSVPEFGALAAYDIIRELDPQNLEEAAAMVLHTLPLPLPCNNYSMLFAPEQAPEAHQKIRPSLGLHQAVPDFELEHSRQFNQPITLGNWLRAQGELTVTLVEQQQAAKFLLLMQNLVPNSLYTVMALRENDLNPLEPSRPGPLGIPNCFITDEEGCGRYQAIMQNPFPAPELNQNRIINIVVLFMSSQCAHGGAIGLYGLGGDIHAQLKLPQAAFSEFITISNN